MINSEIFRINFINFLMPKNSRTRGNRENYIIEHSILIFSLLKCYTVPIEVIAIYTYYHGITTHSGINFKAKWWQPWQPDSIFHDNHHQYYHVNFGFNFEIWDKVSKLTSNLESYSPDWDENSSGLLSTRLRVFTWGRKQVDWVFGENTKV